MVELKDPDSGQMVNGTIHKMTDSSMYTVGEYSHVFFVSEFEPILTNSLLCCSHCLMSDVNGSAQTWESVLLYVKHTIILNL